MALIIICGLPCSGKSSIAAQINSSLTSAGHQVRIVDEPGLNLTRSHSYSSAVNEKITRGSLKAAVERFLSRELTVIFESINGIKGYRYEVWCAARALGLRYCLVHCQAQPEASRQVNAARPVSEAYTDAALTDLASRFEVPDSRNRWERPLFTIRDGAEAAEQLQAIVAAATGQDQDARQAKELQPTTATRNATLSETNLLTQVDSASQEVIRLVSEAQSADTSSSPAAVEIDGQSHTLPSRMTIAELRKHKRAFMKLVTQNTFSRLENAEGAKLMFLEYLCSKL